jgi:meso-butanediol dehydrogenase/(S,S)-butanediol dehydrogenase/diacetyl reductase
MRLRDRLALVTGAGSGIGRAIATRVAREGATVVVADLNADGGRGTVAEIEQLGGQALFVSVDVASGEQTQRMVREAVEAFGRIDVLVNNAAIGGGDDILATDEQTWDRVLSVVLKSVFLCTRAVLPGMLEQGRGSIVNIASVNGMYGLGEEAYSAAKAGVINLSQNLAIRYGGGGVRCNVLCPGTVRTPIWRDRVERRPDIFEHLADWYPVGRVGEPEDIAAAAVFLASDEAAFINGAVLPVDGGLTAGLYRLSRELEGE